MLIDQAFPDLAEAELHPVLLQHLEVALIGLPSLWDADVGRPQLVIVVSV